MAKTIQADMKAKVTQFTQRQQNCTAQDWKKGCLNNSKENKGAIEARF